jgi:methionyl-tRNA formyltransferase
MLPRWRGASPIQSAILHDKNTGVTIMLVDAEMDHGPIVAQARIELEGWPPKASVLSEILASEGGRLLGEIIPNWIAGTITPEAQDPAKATFCKKIQKEDGHIELDGDAEQNYRKIQAYDLWPGTYFFAERNGKEIRVKIAEAELTDGTLHINRVIPEGKSEMDYEDFLRG